MFVSCEPLTVAQAVSMGLYFVRRSPTVIIFNVCFILMDCVAIWAFQRFSVYSAGCVQGSRLGLE